MQNVDAAPHIPRAKDSADPWFDIDRACSAVGTAKIDCTGRGHYLHFLRQSQALLATFYAPDVLENEFLAIVIWHVLKAHHSGEALASWGQGEIARGHFLGKRGPGRD